MEKLFRNWLYIFLLELIITNVKGQNILRFKTFHYSVNEGLLQSSMNDMCVDKNNYLWLSFPNGIQKFDGFQFSQVNIQKGLPDDKQVDFLLDKNNDLLISHSQGISKYNAQSNSFLEVYHKKSINPSTFIGNDEGNYYFIDGEGYVVGLQSPSHKIISKSKESIFNSIGKSSVNQVCDSIINHNAVFTINYTTYLYDLRLNKIIKEFRLDHTALSSKILYTSSNELVYFKKGEKAYLENINLSTNKIKRLLTKDAPTPQVFTSGFFKWRDQQLLSINNKLYQYDVNQGQIKGQILNFQNQSISKNSPFRQAIEDKYGNLYLRTINEGIIKVMNSQIDIKLYNNNKPNENYALSVLADKVNNKIIVGTYGNGIQVYDTSQNLTSVIRYFPNTRKTFSPVAIVKSQKNSYLIFPFGGNNPFLFNTDNNTLKNIIVKKQRGKTRTNIKYFAKVLQSFNDVCIVQIQNKIYKINLNTLSIEEYNLDLNIPYAGHIFQNHLIIHTDDYLYFLDTAEFKIIQRIRFPNSGGIRCFYSTKDKLYIGSNKGIYITDKYGVILKTYNRNTSMPDECVYSIYLDRENNILCATNKGILKINQNNEIIQLTRDDGLQENEFNTNAFDAASDGEVYFGGVNGVSSFYPNEIVQFSGSLNLILTNLKVNNQEKYITSSLSNLKEIELNHDENNLSFDFIAMGSSNPQNYVYQYRMLGIDKEWTVNNNMQSIKYFLQPGEYTLQIYASKYFEKNAKPLKEVRINIKPHFLNTWYFLICMYSIILATIVFIINLINKAKYSKEISNLENERRLNSERERISRDLHDNLGGYANAIVYNTDQLKRIYVDNENDEIIKELQFNSKDIILSLRETVWALKKDQFTDEECFIRIKNYLIPLIQSYKKIIFSIDADRFPGKILIHSTALDVVRIVQESVNNAIKHSRASKISIESSHSIDGWIIKVIDNGIGFDLNTAKEGNGLENMHRRAKDSNLNFNLNTNVNNGTTITLII